MIDNFPSPPKIVFSLALRYFRQYERGFWPKTRNIACSDGTEVFGKKYFRIAILCRFKDFKCILGGSIVVLTTQTGYSRKFRLGTKPPESFVRLVKMAAQRRAIEDTRSLPISAQTL